MRRLVLIVVEPQTEPQKKQGAACGRQPHVFTVTIALFLIFKNSNVIAFLEEWSQGRKLIV
jgi:hypothetical protein